MATKSGQVTLHGRFSPGTEVRLVEVRDETVLRSEGGKEIATATVDDDGRVQFKKGVTVGARYFIVGYQDGFPLEIRVRGNTPADDTVLAQPPVQPDRTRRADGTWSDEFPKRVKAPGSEVGPAPAQHQVAKGTPQRSDTPLGYATPVDPDETAPYPGQDDVGKGEAQRSDTERGQATPIPHEQAPAQSEPAAGTWQRSDTPLGTATPIPKGDAVQAQLDRENAETKAAVGEPVKAAALPVDAARSAAKGLPAKASSPAKVEDLPRETVAPLAGAAVTEPDTSGRDAEGQPVSEDVAAAAGVEQADKPAEARRTPKRANRSRSQKRK